MVLTVLSSFLRQSCLVFTNVTSTLEVFLNVMRYINPRFTYLLTLLSKRKRVKSDTDIESAATIININVSGCNHNRIEIGLITQVEVH